MPAYMNGNTGQVVQVLTNKVAWEFRPNPYFIVSENLAVDLNPGPAEPRNIWETLTNLLCITRKYPDALADLLMTICMSENSYRIPHGACT